MNYTKALRAAHILHKFCNRRKCDTCIFCDPNGNRTVCRLNTPPRYYQLKDIDEMLYEQTNKEDKKDDICRDKKTVD